MRGRRSNPEPDPEVSPLAPNETPGAGGCARPGCPQPVVRKCGRAAPALLQPGLPHRGLPPGPPRQPEAPHRRSRSRQHQQQGPPRRPGLAGPAAARPPPGRPRYWPRQALCRLPCQPDSRRHRPPTPGNPSPDQIEQASRASRELCDAPARELRDGRQVSVRHADDHVHVVATLARQDGRRVFPHNDYYRAGEASREVEAKYGLSPTAASDRTAAKRPTYAETQKTARRGRAEPVRDTLRRQVRTAAAGATTIPE